MPFLKGGNPHRPAPGSVLKVEPIRDKRAIGRIKKMLRDHPSDLHFTSMVKCQERIKGQRKPVSA